jgi:aminopeptidase N
MLAVIALFALVSCKSKKTQRSTEDGENAYWESGEMDFETDPITFYPDETEEAVQLTAREIKGSRTVLHDLIHTRLEISFDWQKQQAHGKALLELQPYFYASSSLTLDAKGMDLHRVALIKNKDTSDLKHEYRENKIQITLDREYKRGEKYFIYIDYTAKPNELEDQEGGSAISSAKGLYFINPENKEKNKVSQIWTQGETESSSCWFPTIDAPNEKMTHEIFITVADSLLTVSNGKMLSQKKNADGTRTDYWKMDQPHSVYLVAMVIGKFHVEKDQWRGIPLSYYVEEALTPSAGTLFKNTPQMLEFFSTQLNYPYPWQKYDQAVVFDFVSGAMENTGITIHGDMLRLDTRELLDASYEDVIAHELYHHWFGNLVTCESWGQLPLNESFATYGEYLWKEHRYGRMEADAHLKKSRERYFNESDEKQVSLVRYDYENPMDMFDAHSYQKGACVLHMLRKYVGDEAFFLALNKYLTDFAYRTAEIHDLRKSFEYITGEDLSWFFDQWFMQSGHPDLKVVHYFEEEMMEYSLEVYQEQDLSSTPLFRLPVNLTFYFRDSSYTTRLDIKESQQSWSWTLSEKPLWVSFDDENMLLAGKEELKNEESWFAQLKYSSLYQDKSVALRQLASAENTELKKEAVSLAIADSFYLIRNEGFALLLELPEAEQQHFAGKIKDNAENHPRSDTRASAFYTLSRLPSGDLEKTVDQGLNDSSYMVNAAALTLLSKMDSEKAYRVSEDIYSKSKSFYVRYTALSILSDGPGDYMETFEREWKAEEAPNFYVILSLIRYIKSTQNHEVVYKGLNLFNSFEPQSESDYFMVLFIGQINKQTEERYKEKLSEVNGLLANASEPARKQELEREKAEIEKVLRAVMSF